MSELDNFNKLCENERKKANPCAWCDREKGIIRTRPVSHGICEKHMEIELAGLYDVLASKWGYMV